MPGNNAGRIPAFLGLNLSGKRQAETSKQEINLIIQISEKSSEGTALDNATLCRGAGSTIQTGFRE